MNQSNNLFDPNSLFITQLKENWQWYLALGIGLAIVGTLAVIFSFMSTLISVIFLGSLLITLGIFEGIKSFKVNQWSGFFLHILLSVLYIVGGIFIVWNPLANAVSLTLLLAIFFVISGALRIYFAATHNIPNKMWLFFNGAITVLLGILIWHELPFAGMWVIGTFIGIDMIFTGWTWIMLSLAARKMNPPNLQ